MGCVTSKHLKRQAQREGHLEKPTFIRKVDSMPSNNELSFEEYHRHLVAFRSSSYSLLKVDTPSKVPESVKKNNARVGSMNDIYDKLEYMDSAQKSWNEAGSTLQTLKPSLGRSITSPLQRSPKTEVQETIDIADMMQGLEEEASGSSSPAQDVSLVSIGIEPPRPPPPPPLPLARALSRRKHRKAGSCPEMVNSYNVEKLPGTLLGDIKSVSSHVVAAHHNRLALARLEDNINSPPSQGELPYLQTNEHLCKETTVVTRENTRTVVEDTSLNARGMSNVTYLTSSGRLRLTLDMEFDNRLFTSTSFSQDGFSPASSSARRSLVDCLSEPGSPFFDPALLASYERAMRELRKEDWKIVPDSDEMPQHTRFFKELDNMDDTPAVEEVEEDENTGMVVVAQHQSNDPLDEFERKCPPGGEEAVVLYTTTLRGIRKTFEDCNHVRELMQSFSIVINERDVSMHLKFRNELKELMEQVVSVPRVFIKGRYVGGVDEIKRLHEDGKLDDLVKGLPKEVASGVCDGCGGIRFVPCLECSGSCKVLDQVNAIIRCSECNENGLIQCPICS